MKITDNRTITLEIDGTEHVLTATEAQQLYDQLGTLSGIRRHVTTPWYPSTWSPNTIHVGPGYASTPNTTVRAIIGTVRDHDLTAVA
jgi:hypothetical protein